MIGATCKLIAALVVVALCASALGPWAVLPGAAGVLGWIGWHRADRRSAWYALDCPPPGIRANVAIALYLIGRRL